MLVDLLLGAQWTAERADIQGVALSAPAQPALRQSLLIERTRRVYEQSLRGMPFSFMVGGMVVAGLESARGSIDLIWWWAALAVLTLLRHNHARRVLSRPITEANAAKLSAWFTFGVGFEGLMWGVSFMLVAVSIGDRATVFMGCAVAGISVAALTTMAAGRAAFPVFLSCLALPVLVTLGLLDRAEGASVGAMVVLFGLNLVLAYLHSHAADTAEIKMQFDQQAAVNALAKANRRIEVLSRTDALTGLANRREFDERLEVEWLRSERGGEPVGLVMLDIDKFKAYNDAGGHPAGDECLRRVAVALRSAVHRPSDLVARFGGEEFVVLLPGTDAAGALEVAEQLRSTIERLALPRPDDADRVVTVSAGASAAVARKPQGSGILTEAADRAMYLAKSQGRNRARCLPESITTQSADNRDARAARS